MALAHGYALPFEALRRTGVLAQNTADATIRATADGATKEAAGSCLDARALEVQQRTVVQPSILVVPQLTRNGVVLNQLPDTRTNFIQNNTMTGATGSVAPTTWSVVAPPSGITIGYSASGQTTAADGTLVDYIDVTVSGTALTSGNFNLRPEPVTSTVSGNLLFAAGMTYTASFYMSLLSGSVSGVSPNYQIQEVSGTTFVSGTSLDLSAITSNLTRYSVTRPIAGTGGADRIRTRYGHAIASGQVLNYTIRIASPQLEKGSVATPVIRTASGFVSVDMLGVARDGAPPDFTFTRATTATRVNASGLIESVASGLLRLDYPVTGGCPAALIEASGTNLVFQSQNITSGTVSTFSQWFDSASLQGTSTSVQNNVSGIIAPDGTQSASLVSMTRLNVTGSTGSSTYVSQIQNLAVSGTYTSTIYIRAKDSNQVGKQINVWQWNGSAIINMILVTLTNDWQRVETTKVSTLASGNRELLGFGFRQNQGNDLSAEFYVWGAQGELGSVATTYIPTTSGAVSRAADVISASGALVSGLIGQTEGTIYAEVDIRNMAKETYIIRIDDGATANSVTLRTLTSNVIRTAITAPTTSGTLNISSAAFTAGIVKIAFAYKSGEIALSVNGATALTANGTFAFGASFNRITLGSNQSPSSEFNDRIRAAALYTTRLSNDQLQSLTRLT